MLASHGDFAWVSKHQNKLAQYGVHAPWLAFANRILDVPGFGERLVCQWPSRKMQTFIPTPSEPWFFWEAYLKNFRWRRKAKGQSPDDSPRRRTEKDLTEREAEQARRAVRRVMRWQGKPRFISKYTDFPRLNYLKRIFPEAKFIHIHREKHAVINSYHSWLTEGPAHSWVDAEEREWWISGWPSTWQREWKETWARHPEAPLAFTTFKYKFMREKIGEALEEHTYSNCIDTSYSKLTSDPKIEVKKLLGFCGLPIDRRVKTYLQCTEIENRNYKWKKRLSDNQKLVIEKVLNKH